MSKDQVDFKVLRKPTSPNFSSELNAAPALLKVKEASHFFKILLSDLQNGVSTEIGNQILVCIAKVLFTERYTETFLMEGFAPFLPFSQKKLSSGIFEILRILLEQEAHQEVITEEILRQFETIIPFDPYRALTIIAIYSQKFAQRKDPFPFVDLLFQHEEFHDQAIASPFCSLIAYLYKTYQDFRQSRGKECWSTLTEMLSDFKEIVAIQSVYAGLAAISDNRMKVQLPFVPMKKHIVYEELQDHVLIFCLKQKGLTLDRQFAGLLLKAARTNEKATLLILNLCSQSIENAEMILNDTSGWLADPEGLPTMADTLRIFLCLLKYEDLREQIAETPDLIDFLKNVINDDNFSKKSVTLGMVSTIIKRMKLEKGLVIALSKNGFLTSFLDVAKSCNDELAVKSALTLFSTLTPIVYVPEYLRVCDMVSREIIADGPLRDLAYQVAAGFCLHQKCVNRMKEKRLDAFYKKHRSDPKLAQQSDQFLNLIGWNPNETENDSDSN